MEFDPPGRHRTVEAFREHLRSLDPEMDCDLVVEGAAGPLGRPLELFGKRLANRFAVHPMEGWDGTADGLPTALTLRRWQRFGESGAKLIWGGEAFAVREDGRANPRQLFLDPAADTAGGLASLRKALRAGHARAGEDPDDLLVGLQLTHSGRFACPGDAPAPRIVARHPLLDARFGIGPEHPLLTDGELEGIGAAFVAAARLARESGFDFVDLKCCHGYLLHELLGARERAGRYGGSFENRTRLLREIAAAIRTECPGLHLAVRVSVADTLPHRPDAGTGVGAPEPWPRDRPYRHGFGVAEEDPLCFDLEEPLRFLALLRELEVPVVNLSLGSPYYCPHLQRPAAYPPSDGYLPPRDPLLEVIRHLKTARQCKAACPNLLMVGTGYSYLQEWLPHVAQHEIRHGHVDLVGLGRMVLAYPELPRDVLAGRPLDRRRICRTFSDCTTGPRHGLPSGCYPLDPHYRSLPEAEQVRAAKDALR